MWVHMIAVVSLALVCIVWFAVQRVSERPDGGGCNCTQKTPQGPIGRP